MASDPRDYQLDIRGLSDQSEPRDVKSQAASAQPQAVKTPNRPFISVQFNCCKVYQRVYRTSDGERYEGRCPKCGRTIRFRIGAGGTDARAFVVE